MLRHAIAGIGLAAAKIDGFCGQVCRHRRLRNRTLKCLTFLKKKGETLPESQLLAPEFRPGLTGSTVRAVSIPGPVNRSSESKIQAPPHECASARNLGFTFINQLSTRISRPRANFKDPITGRDDVFVVFD